MKGPGKERCMICERPNPRGDNGAPLDWGVTTDKDGDVFGVICPSCVTGERFSIGDGRGSASQLDRQAA